MDCVASDLPASAPALVEAFLSVPDVLVVVLDCGGTVRYVNPAVESKTGYAAEDLQGATLWEALVPSDERENVRRSWEQRRGEREGWRHGHPVRTQMGDRRYVQWIMVPIDDEASSMLGVGVDRTRYRQLEEDVLSASESERRRIGQELHDGLASELIAATISIENLRRRIEQDLVEHGDLLNRLKNIETTVRQGAQQARSLSHLLVGTHVGPEAVPQALSDLTDKQEQVSETPCRLHLPDQDLPSVPNAAVAGHLYRIAQEALRNAVIHASASRVDLTLTVDTDGNSPDEGTDTHKNIVLRVRDDGKGLPDDVQDDLTEASANEEWTGPGAGSSTLGLGLHLMQYRADLIGASLTIESSEGMGTTVTCTLPIQNSVESE